METKSGKSLGRFLYPFRRKPNIFNEIAIGTKLPYWVMQYLNGHTMKQYQTASRNEKCPSQMNLINLGMNPNITFTTKKSHMDISFPPNNINHEKPEQKYTSNKRPSPTEISFEKPKPTAIAPESTPTDTPLKRPIPKNVSLHRADPRQPSPRPDEAPLKYKVGMGVVSGMVATTVVHPLDVVKVRLQLFPKKVATMTMLRRIMVCEGAIGLYAGLTAGWFRQLTYTGARLSVYYSLCDKYTRDHPDLQNPSYGERMRIALAAGLVGAFAGTPSELALVRMIEVRRMRRSRCSPPCSLACKHVRNPESVIPQLIRIAHREGIRTWWRGGVPTLIRSVFVTTAQVGSYHEIKQALERHDHIAAGMELHVCTAVFSSLISAVLSLPVDQVKTRYQSFREKQNHVDILKDMLKKKGVKYLWKGFVPYYVRQFIHTVITYALYDQFLYVYIQFEEGVKKK